MKTKESAQLREVQPNDNYEYITPYNYAKRINKSRERVIQMSKEGKFEIVLISGVQFIELPK